MGPQPAHRGRARRVRAARAADRAEALATARRLAAALRDTGARGRHPLDGGGAVPRRRQGGRGVSGRSGGRSRRPPARSSAAGGCAAGGAATSTTPRSAPACSRPRGPGPRRSRGRPRTTSRRGGPLGLIPRGGVRGARRRGRRVAAGEVTSAATCRYARSWRADRGDYFVRLAPAPGAEHRPPATERGASARSRAAAGAAGGVLGPAAARGGPRGAWAGSRGRRRPRAACRRGSRAISETIEGWLDDATTDPGLKRAATYYNARYARDGAYPDLTEEEIRDDPEAGWGVGVDVVLVQPGGDRAAEHDRPRHDQPAARGRARPRRRAGRAGRARPTSRTRVPWEYRD
ncbi:MAG: hypothetical protein KatS3mg009_2349 [Acidimicrobiia bacterium]|nr:MAG: hypothetical protein KatS3mg009_2349 [Acidimicrobiia bacterium]